MADVAAVVSECAARWPAASAAPLWAPALPGSLTWTQIDEAWAEHGGNGGAALGSVVLGLVEGIESHSPLVWEGGSVQIQTSAHEAALASQWARSIAARIAGASRLPLHVIGDEAVPGASSRLSPRDLGAIDLVEGIRAHGPAVLAISDVTALRSSLAQALSLPQAEELWSSLLTGAARSGVILVAAFSGRFTSSSAAMGAFSMRLVRARDADEALHAGIQPSSLRSLGEAHALLARPGEETALACVPIDPPPTGVFQGTDGVCHAWRIPSPQETAALVSNASAPALIGPEYEPIRWVTDKPWVIIGEPSDMRVVEALHATHGWPTPTIAEIIPENAWTRIVRRDAHRMLALNPSDNVMRGLMRTSRRYPLSIAAHPWNPSCGLIWEDDTLTTVQLTVGSVNT